MILEDANNCARTPNLKVVIGVGVVIIRAATEVGIDSGVKGASSSSSKQH
jgi:hypothetical protein